jgi:predicted nucleotidyltransferase component of viral defense system
MEPVTLHHEAVDPTLFELLQALMQDPRFNAFYLVGGTSLALRFAHRESVDIDLFTHHPFDARPLAAWLKEHYAMVEAETAENTVSGVICGIKVDVIAHRYPLLEPIETVEGIRLAAVADVAAMKLNAIANRGSKKDFWDCAELLRTVPLATLLDFCARKYRGDSLWNVEKSLCYFDDAEDDPAPRDLRGQTWDQVKAIITKHNRL